MRPTRKALPIAFKLACAITCLVLTITVGLTGLLIAGRLRADQQALFAKTVAYGKLASKQLEPAVAFDDVETAREVFEALRLDGEVVAIAIYGDGGGLLASAGDARAVPTGANLGEATLRFDRERVSVAAPVTPREGGRGTVVVELSAASLAAARADMIRTGAGVATMALLLGIVGAWLIGRSLSRRLARLSAAAESISRGELAGRAIEDPTRDEIGRLGEAFDTMRDRLNEMVSLAASRAAEEQQRLDELVRARTFALDERNRKMRFLLDHLDQGVVSVDAEGRLGEEHSKVVVDWFGAPVPGALLGSYLADLGVGPLLEVGWSAIVDGILPLELAIDQLPKTVIKGEKTYAMAVSPVLSDEGRAERFIVFFSDVTASIAQARSVAGQRDLAVALGALAKDRSGFLAQMEEADHLVHGIAATEALSADLTRALHTLKGNAAILGFDSLAEKCHHMETYIAETAEVPPLACRGALVESWRAVFGPLEALCADRGENVVVEREELAALRRAIESGQSKAKLIEQVRAMVYEPAGKRLARLSHWVKRAARRHGKPEPGVDIDDGGIRFDEETWEPFWSSCVHLVRNAVAHGIETPEERESRTKPSSGRLTVRCAIAWNTLTIVFEDDGRGVDWARVRELARERALPSATEDDLVEALFCDGLTTRRDADEVSGRGAGLGAVRQAVQELGGAIGIVSESGRGTAVRMSFSLSTVGSTIIRGACGAQEICT